MKPVQVTFEKMVNLGNFEHQSASVTVALDDYDSAHDAMNRARVFVERELAPPRPDNARWESAKEIMRNPMAHTGYEVEEAKRIIALCEQPDDMPF